MLFPVLPVWLLYVLVPIELWAALAGYTLPLWLAYARQRDNRGKVAQVNLLLGWTGIGWALALYWACT